MPLDPYAAAGTYTAEQEIVENINSTFLPGLRRLLADLQAMQETWEVNGINAKIAAAAGNETALAGFSPAAWAAWGTVFTETLAFLDTPIASLGMTPRQVLLTRYTRV